MEHYFTAMPSSDANYRMLRVTLAGHDITVTTANSLFSPDRLDPGTQALLKHVPEPAPTGNLLDIGCGWGPLSLSLALFSPQATVWGVDPNERAIALTRKNAENLQLRNVRAVSPDNVPSGLTFDTLWSNPPIRVGKAVLHEILTTWLPRLRPEGEAWLVVRKNLGADSLQKWLVDTLGANYEVHRAATERGYRIITVRRLS